MNAIKLMADYGCWPLWDMRPGEYGNVDPADLPLPDALRERLDAWSAAYDATLNEDYPPDSGFATPEDEARFKEEGRALAGLLQEALGAEWRVTSQI